MIFTRSVFLFVVAIIVLFLTPRILIHTGQSAVAFKAVPSVFMPHNQTTTSKVFDFEVEMTQEEALSSDRLNDDIRLRACGNYPQAESYDRMSRGVSVRSPVEWDYCLDKNVWRLRYKSYWRFIEITFRDGSIEHIDIYKRLRIPDIS
jgi:hypothetical protein